MQRLARALDGLDRYKRRVTNRLARLVLRRAGVARWSFAFMAAASPVPGFSMIELCVDLFVVAMVVWDLASRGAGWAVSLLGH